MSRLSWMTWSKKIRPEIGWCVAELDRVVQGR
jgi:hypothetical protein